jgi:acyl CoA:acetate/3-ketoacid CoA transferase alpha subunit
MAQVVELAEAVEALIHDGDSGAMEGFTHLIPFAAGHEVIRQGRRHLTVIRLTPDVFFDQLIGMGCADRMIFSWGGNPGVGSLHRFRDAVEHGWPCRLEVRHLTVTTNEQAPDPAWTADEMMTVAAARALGVLRALAKTKESQP